MAGKQQQRRDRDECASDEKLALAEIEGLGGVVGDVETQGHQGIDAAQCQATEHGLKNTDCHTRNSDRSPYQRKVLADCLSSPPANAITNGNYFLKSAGWKPLVTESSNFTTVSPFQRAR